MITTFPTKAWERKYASIGKPYSIMLCILKFKKTLFFSEDNALSFTIELDKGVNLMLLLNASTIERFENQ